MPWRSSSAKSVAQILDAAQHEAVAVHCCGRRRRYRRPCHPRVAQLPHLPSPSTSSVLLLPQRHLQQPPPGYKSFYTLSLSLSWLLVDLLIKLTLINYSTKSSYIGVGEAGRGEIARARGRVRGRRWHALHHNKGRLVEAYARRRSSFFIFIFLLLFLLGGLDSGGRLVAPRVYSLH